MKKFYFILFFIFLWLWNIYWYIIYSWNSTTNIWVSNSSTTTSFNFFPKNYATTSSEYITQNKRMYFDLWDWVFNSEVFWDFVPDWRVDLIRSSTVNANCDWESVSYYFVWNFRNRDNNYSLVDSWWKWFESWPEWSNNYFCPNSWLFSIPLVSRESEVFFDTFVVTNNSTPTYLEVTVNDSNWNAITLDERVIFSNARLAIWWIINTQSEITNEFTWWSYAQAAWNTLIWLNFWATSQAWTLTTIYSNIKKNIINLSRWLSWNTTISTINSLGNQYTFIDYEWQQISTPSNVNNRWRILTLGNNPNWVININWEKNLVLKWWNLYINSNISNSNNNSILTIVVLRDETNNTNWWNVYIHPDVTNIDAIIISEWSILSYNWSVLNSIDNANSLRKQLLIYGTVVSRNTIWQNISIFNTDDYISTWNSTSSNKYNFENLRNFQVVISNQITTWTCNNPNKITAIWSDETTSINNAFAWRKQCYFDDTTTLWLRSTHRTASTVIEYNPNLQLLSPKNYTI
jgi:hypothetical protein